MAALQKDQGTFFDKIWLLGSHARSQFVIDQNNYVNLKKIGQTERNGFHFSNFLFEKTSGPRGRN